MKRVTIRTLILLVELLAVVAAYQFTTWAPPAGAAVVWLDGAPAEPVDPNVPDEPESPGPEAGVGTIAIWHLQQSR